MTKGPTSKRRPEGKLQIIGERLKVTRLALNLTQLEISRVLNVDRVSYTNWERGKYLPDALTMARLGDIHGIPMDWIYRGDPSNLPYRLTGKLLKAAS